MEKWNRKKNKVKEKENKINKNKINNSEFIKKIEKCLISSLKYLYINHVSLETFLDKNPFALKPFEIPCKNLFNKK